MINEIGTECFKILHRAGIMHNVYWIRLSECICIDFTLSICVHRSEATGLGVFLLFIWALTGMTRQFCYASNGNNKWLIAFGNTKITPYFYILFQIWQFSGRVISLSPYLRLVFNTENWPIGTLFAFGSPLKCFEIVKAVSSKQSNS